MPLLTNAPFRAVSYASLILGTQSATVIGYWPMDTLDTGITPDLSGNGYDLTRTNTDIVLDAANKQVGEGSMTLPTPSNRHLERTESFSGGFFNSFSVETWLYPTIDPNTARYVLMGTRVDNQPAWGLTLLNGPNFPNGPPKVQVRAGGAAGGNNVTVALDTWSHVVGMHDTVTGWKLYVNGSLIESNSNSLGPVSDSTKMSCGSDYFGNGGLGSNIDELVLYQGLLSVDDITAHYNAGLTS